MQFQQHPRAPMENTSLNPWMVFLSHYCSQQSLAGIHILCCIPINSITDYPELEKTHKNH